MTGRKATSGLMLSEGKDGTVEMGFVDYGVDFFGSNSTYECWYMFDKENSDKLRAALGEKYEGSLEEQAIAAFGKNFNTPIFGEFCQEHGIQYTKDSWTSFDDDWDD